MCGVVVTERVWIQEGCFGRVRSCGPWLRLWCRLVMLRGDGQTCMEEQRRGRVGLEEFVCCHLKYTVTAAWLLAGAAGQHPWFLRLGETHRSFSNNSLLSGSVGNT